MFFDQASEFSLFALDIVAVFAARLPAGFMGNSFAFSAVFYFGRVKLFSTPSALRPCSCSRLPAHWMLPFAFSLGTKVGNLISKSSSSTPTSCLYFLAVLAVMLVVDDVTQNI